MQSQLIHFGLMHCFGSLFSLLCLITPFGRTAESQTDCGLQCSAENGAIIPMVNGMPSFKNKVPITNPQLSPNGSCKCVMNTEAVQKLMKSQGLDYIAFLKAFNTKKDKGAKWLNDNKLSAMYTGRKADYTPKLSTTVGGRTRSTVDAAAQERCNSKYGYIVATPNLPITLPKMTPVGASKTCVLNSEPLKEFLNLKNLNFESFLSKYKKAPCAGRAWLRIKGLTVSKSAKEKSSSKSSSKSTPSSSMTSSPNSSMRSSTDEDDDTSCPITPQEKTPTNKQASKKKVSFA